MSPFCELFENCSICTDRYNMPYYFCCLEECGEHQWCKLCRERNEPGGIYSDAYKKEVLVEAKPVKTRYILITQKTGRQLSILRRDLEEQIEGLGLPSICRRRDRHRTEYEIENEEAVYRFLIDYRRISYDEYVKLAGIHPEYYMTDSFQVRDYLKFRGGEELPVYPSVLDLFRKRKEI